MTDKKAANPNEEKYATSFAKSRATLEAMRDKLNKQNEQLSLRVSVNKDGWAEETEHKEADLAAFNQHNRDYIAELDKMYAALTSQLEWVGAARNAALAAERAARELSSHGKITDERNL